MPDYTNTLKYFGLDYPRSLFPLETNRIVITSITDKVAEQAYLHILKEEDGAFLPQARVYASKQGYHLRRTMKLDPVAEFFIYDLVYRNRSSFRKDFQPTRSSFGYRFQGGDPLSPSQSYRDFRTSVLEASKTYNYCAKFDISSYFNSIYHHDLVAWFNDGSRNQEDVDAFDKFLRQINSGRSVDCLPQGIDPCKMIGSHFLKFIDNSNRLRSDILLRFMDDFYLFSNNEDKLLEDFTLIQRMLGDKGLSINPLKTNLGQFLPSDIKKEVDEIKLHLLNWRRAIIESSGIEGALGGEVKVNLDEEKLRYLLDMLRNEDIEEEDAELILVLMRDHTSDVLGHVTVFLKRFPNLIKNIYMFGEHVADKSLFADIILEFLKGGDYITEYQLFWLAKISEDYLRNTDKISQILNLLYEHPNASVISRAKLLEIPEQRFGMQHLREEHLRTGQSDWLAWSAAVGSRQEKKANRNHLLRYFANGSIMNRLISDCVTNI